MNTLLVRIALNAVVAFGISLSTHAQGIHYSSYTDWHTRCVEAPSWPHGTAQSNRPEYALNVDKNQAEEATGTTNVTMSQLNASGDDEDRFEEGQAAQLTGWVTNVKMGGVETCNCGAGPGPHNAHDKDSFVRDTHIEIKSSLSSSRLPIIVEVTPLIRHMIADQSGNSLDWTTKHLRQILLNHKIRISGFMLFDVMHRSNARNTNPHGGSLWRQSAWEIHPITKLELLHNNGTIDNTNGATVNGGLQ